MKFLTAFLLGSFLTSASLAAQIPSYKEYMQITKQIETEKSVRSIITQIKSGKLNPMIEYYDGNILSKAGRSSLAALVIRFRLNSQAPIGDVNENIELLNVIKEKGLDVNIEQTTNVDLTNNTFMDMAAKVCSVPAVNWLLQNGADPSLEDFYWVVAFRKWFAAESGSQHEKDCFAISDFFADKAQRISRYSARELFYPFIDEVNGGVGSFTEGANLIENFSPKMIESLKNLGIKLSPRPEGELPSDEWYKTFTNHVGVAIGQDYENRGNIWFDKLTEKEKAWACYYSSFDEALVAFHQNGLTDEILTSKSIGGSYTMRVMSTFMVYKFGPYCNSLK